MTTAYTSLLGLALPVTGELSGTWGDTVNNSITSLLDSAIAGTTTLSSDVDVTLTTTTGASNTSRQAILLWTAGGTVTRNITAPAQSKIYTVINASSSTQSIVLRGAGPTTGVTIVKGESAVCAWNGSDFIKISNTSGAGVFTTVTASSLTSGRVIFASTAGLLADSANLTWNGTALAVTGTLSATGNATLSGATAEIQFTGATYGWLRATVGDLYIDAPSTKSIFLRNAGTTIGAVSSTGLAVTGVLTTTGAITTTGGSNVQTSWTLAEAGTRSLVLKNPTSTLNASVGTGTNHDLQVEGNTVYINTGSFGSRSIVGTFSSTGLAVTGYITATNTSNTTVATGGFDASTSWSLKVANASTTAGTGAGIFFLGGTNSESWIGNLYESSGVGALSFQTRVSGTRAERMRIDNSGNLLVGTTDATVNATQTAKVVGGNFRSLSSIVTVPGSSTVTLLTLSSTVNGVYIIQGNLGSQGNQIYGGMLIVVANTGSFRIVTDGSGSSCSLTLSGANVRITNPVGSALDGFGSAILVAN